MSDSKGIPILNHKTGQTTFAKPAPRQAPKQETATQELTAPSAATQAPPSPPPASSSTRAESPAGPVSKKDTPGKAAGAKEKVEIGSLAELLAHAYSLKGRRVSLNTKLTKAVASECRLDAAQRETLAALSANDQQLVVAKQLLLLTTTISGFPHLRSALREAVRSALLNHPAFKGPLASSFLMTPSDAAPLSHVLAELQRFELISSAKEDKESAKTAPVSQLRDNACFCLALWHAESSSMTLPRIVESLYTAIWEPAARKLESEEARWRTLADLKDVEAVGLACDVFRREFTEQFQKCQQALADVQDLAQQASQLAQQNQHLQYQLQEHQESAKRELEALRQQMKELQTKAEIQAVHQRDDAEQIRSRLLRRLKADLSNLEEGLTALRRPEPKVHVMMDIAERVTDAIRKEIRNLQGEE